MPTQQAEIGTLDFKVYYSGGSKDMDVITESYASIGGYRSAVAVANGAIHNLFDEVAVGEAYVGKVETKCFFLKNINTTKKITELSMYIDGKADYEKISFGVALPTSNTGYVQMLNSSRELPLGVTFYEAYSVEDAVGLIPELGIGGMIAIWIQREIIGKQTVVKVAKKELTLKFSWNTVLDVILPTP